MLCPEATAKSKSQVEKLTQRMGACWRGVRVLKRSGDCGFAVFFVAPTKCFSVRVRRACDEPLSLSLLYLTHNKQRHEKSE